MHTENELFADGGERRDRVVPHISRAAGTKCANPLGHLAADTD
ncbi:Uncharacterised protein [Mycobacteroides abscessus subsp. abscessus]|nr:hypothetical protein MA6G0728S_0640 [Mycobacteroides abscessus 6G-0728-S]SKU16480.1 Uncharacterised protein [Mycobacteroides abscessus subsp. abscessus]